MKISELDSAAIAAGAIRHLENSPAGAGHPPLRELAGQSAGAGDPSRRGHALEFNDRFQLGVPSAGLRYRARRRSVGYPNASQDRSRLGGLQAHPHRENADRRRRPVNPLVTLRRTCAPAAAAGLIPVHADCAVVVDTNAYSVPWRLIGERYGWWSGWPTGRTSSLSTSSTPAGTRGSPSAHLVGSTAVRARRPRRTGLSGALR